MTEYLTKDVLAGLDQARAARRKRRSRLRVQIGDEVYPVLRLDTDKFSIDAKDAPHMRGLIDIYDGARHLYQALVVASASDGFAMTYEFKRNTVASDHAPLDFERAEDAPVALIPMH